MLSTKYPSLIIDNQHFEFRKSSLILKENVDWQFTLVISQLIKLRWRGWGRWVVNYCPLPAQFQSHSKRLPQKIRTSKCIGTDIYHLDSRRCGGRMMGSLTLKDAEEKFTLEFLYQVNEVSANFRKNVCFLGYYP